MYDLIAVHLPNIKKPTDATLDLVVPCMVPCPEIYGLYDDRLMVMGMLRILPHMETGRKSFSYQKCGLHISSRR